MDLPKEILEIIALYLEPDDRITLRGVVKQFRDVLEITSMWSDVKAVGYWFMRSFISLDSIKWTCKILSINRDMLIKNYKHLFYLIADSSERNLRHCDVAVLEWLVGYLKITVDDVRSDNSYALKVYCRSGRFEIVKYLFDNLDLTKEDIKRNNNYLITVSCRFGHFNLVKWLIEKFDFTINELRVHDNSILRHACATKDVEIVKYLTNKFPFTIQDIRCSDNDALMMACDGGYTEVVQYICGHFKLTEDDVRDNENYAIRKVCNNGYVDILDWLFSNFNLNVRDLMCMNNRGVKQACKYGRANVIEWIVRYYLIRDEYPDLIKYILRKLKKYYQTRIYIKVVKQILEYFDEKGQTEHELIACVLGI